MSRTVITAVYRKGAGSTKHVLKAALSSASMPALVLASAIIASDPAAAQTWTGATSTDWTVGSNWSGGVPTTGAVTINTTSPNPTVLGASGGTTGTSGNLSVGSGGTGSLTIQNGSTLTTSGTGFSFIGANGSSGTMNVTGAGSAWILNGSPAAVSVIFGQTETASVGALTISNSGSVKTAGDFAGGNVTLNVTSGGTLTTGRDAYLGRLLGANATATISGAGSQWTIARRLLVGNGGTGALTISNSGTVDVATSTTVGDSGGQGTFNINSGGALQTQTLVRGTGPVQVNFNNGTVRAKVDSTAFISGFSGTELNIAAGGLTIDTAGFNVTASSPFTGTGAFTEVGGGTLTLTGHSTYSGITTVAGSTLVLQNGGQIVGSAQANANGTNSAITVTGAGSLLQTGTSIISSGTASTATLNVLAGGVFRTTGGNVTVGGTGTAGTTGTLNVSGAGSLVDVSGGLIVSTTSTGVAGTVNITGGGQIHSASGGIGWTFGPGAARTVTVSDAGSAWAMTGALTFNNGAMSVLSGGAVSAASAAITGAGSNHNANLLVSGAGSTYSVSGNQTTGSGTATITLANSGTMNIGGQLTLGNTAFNIGGAEGQAATVAGTLNAATLAFGTGTGRVNFNETDSSYTFSTAMSGGGTVNQTGTGTTILTANNSYAGPTNVQAGSLIINGNQSTATGLTTVSSGATLGGTGTIGGSVTVGSGGALNPGNPGTAPGTLTINGNLALAGGSTLNYRLGQANIAGGALNDLVNVSGNLTLAGTLNVTTTSGSSFDPGIYRVFNYSGALTNNGLAIGTIPSSGYYIQTSVANQVNLINTTGLNLSFWDGASALRNDSVIEGSSGTWILNSNENWTTANGAINAPFQNGAFAIFQTAPGTVTVDNSQGAISVSGMQFALNGYVIQGDPVTLAGTQATIRVGDGTGAGAAYVATVAASLTGSSQLVKTDLGTLVLSGANSYTGGTAINGGTVQVSSDSNLGAASGGLTFGGGTLENTAAFSSARAVTVNSGGGTLQTDADLTLSGAISGAGAITKTGSGTLTLTGANSYTGIEVKAGTLSVSSDGNLGQGTVTLDQATTLAFTQTGTYSHAVTLSGDPDFDVAPGQTVIYSGAITDGSSPGVLVKTNSGTLVLTGANSYSGGTTIGAGTLVGSATSFGSGAVLDNATFVIDQPANAIFANAINGNGSFTKQGAGRLNYTGTGTLSGPSTVAAGLLSVNGSLAGSPVTVQGGGSLGGNGTVGAATIQAGGTIAPGNSIGTLQINGAFIQASGSTYQVEVDPNSNAADLIQVGGPATLQTGAGLNVTKSVAGNYQVGTVYRVLTAAGGLGGSYTLSGQTTGVSAFLGLKDSYDANNAYLTVVQTQPITTAASTPDQQAVAGAVASLPVSDPVPSAVLNVPDVPSARAAFDQLSGQVQASAQGALLSNGLYMREVAFDRLRDVICTPVGQQGRKADCQDSRLSVWAQGFGGWGGIAGNGNAVGLDHSAAGFLVGVDVPINALDTAWRLGVFGGYSHGDFDLASGGAGGQSNDYHLGLYGGTVFHDVAFRLGTSYSWSGVTTDRSVIIGNFSDTLRAIYNGGTTQTFGEIGHRVDLEGFSLEPFANLTYVSLHTAGFTEAGGPAALTVKANTLDNVVTTLGIRPSTDVTLDGFNGTLRGMAGWRHTTGTVIPTSVASFAGSGPFSLSGTPIARDAGALEAGLDMRVMDGMTVGLTYGGQFSNRSTDQMARGTIRIGF